MRLICVKGRRISNFLIQTNKRAYPMEDTVYLKTLPLHKESYITMQKNKQGTYKLLKYLFVLDK